jgi:hypothetical protein
MEQPRRPISKEYCMIRDRQRHYDRLRNRLPLDRYALTILRDFQLLTPEQQGTYATQAASDRDRYDREMAAYNNN